MLQVLIKLWNNGDMEEANILFNNITILEFRGFLQGLINYICENKMWYLIPLLAEKGMGVNEINKDDQLFILRESYGEENWWLTKWLLRKRSFCLEELREKGVLEKFLNQPDFQVFSILLEKYDFIPSDEDRKIMFERASQHGNAPMVQHLIDGGFYETNLMKFLKLMCRVPQPIRKMNELKRVIVFELVVEKIENRDIDAVKLLNYACDYGELQIALYIIKKFNLGTDHVNLWFNKGPAGKRRSGPTRRAFKNRIINTLRLMSQDLILA
jgi:hypothetical protein